MQLDFYERIHPRYTIDDRRRSSITAKIWAKPTFSIGIYLRVLYALSWMITYCSLARDDKLGRALQDMGLKNRHIPPLRSCQVASDIV
ncbi:hypothetical protein EXN75_00350 [Segatella hominis]|uniref:Uncharacterized protein n=1 Tax=Segatella hominis TaxID=2518605 RepID=A0A4Y8VVV9_9BACT|nr:hypothetical protein EXN75_00350 [Segatella hominis]